MSRIRWFRVKTKGDLGELERQIRSRVFSLHDSVSSGFRVDERSSAGLVGQFMHKRTVDQKIVLPTGEEFVQEVVNIDITKFGLDFSGRLGLLSLMDPPRSTTPFFSALSEVTGFSCMIETLEVNVEEWIRHLVQENDQMTVIYLEVAGIVISQSIQARIALAGDRDVDVTMRECISFGQGGKIENAKIRYRMAGNGHSVIELGGRASLKTPPGFPSESIPMFRNAMLLAAKED